MDIPLPNDSLGISPSPALEPIPKMWLHPRFYRTRLLLDVLRIVVLPIIVFSQICYYTGIDLGHLGLPGHVFFVILWGSVNNKYYDFQQERLARKVGAKLIPRVKGSWPGNIDVLLRMMKAFKTAYLMDVYLELFKEYKCTTLNTRILWVDQVQ